jgi:hypothetical protein
LVDLTTCPTPGSVTPHVLSPVLMCGVAVHRVIEGIEGGTFKVLVEERFPMA